MGGLGFYLDLLLWRRSTRPEAFASLGASANFEFQFFSSNCLIFQFLTSDSNSTGRNPPRAHLRMSENLHFEISAPLRRVGKILFYDFYLFSIKIMYRSWWCFWWSWGWFGWSCGWF